MKLPYYAVWLFLVLGLTAPCPSFSVKPMNLKKQIEAFRTKLPEPKTLSEQNGFCIEDINGKQITMTLLARP